MIMLKNLALIAISVLVALLLSVAADRVLGMVRPDPSPPGSMELVFPPNSNHVYETADFTYTVQTNSLGLREREISAKNSETYRICAIGDSYTYGWGVEAEQTWLRCIEENLRSQGYQVETINLGKPGEGPPFYAELAEKAIPVLRPDLVLVALLQGNDLGAAGPEQPKLPAKTISDTLLKVYPNTVRWLRDLRRNRDFATRGQDTEPPQRTNAEDNRRSAANTAKDFYDNKMTPEQRAKFDAFDAEVKDAYFAGKLNPYLIDLAMQNPHFYCLTMDMENGWTKTCIEHTAGHLGRIKQVCDDWDVRMIALSIPEGSYVNEDALKNMRRMGYQIPDAVLDNDAPDEGIRRAAALAGVPFLNVTQAFKERRTERGLFFTLDGHLTPKGHRLYGDALTPLLLEAVPELPRR